MLQKLSDQELHLRIAQALGWTGFGHNPLGVLLGVPPDGAGSTGPDRQQVPHWAHDPRAFASLGPELRRRGIELPSWPTLRQRCEALLHELEPSKPAQTE